MNFNHAARCRIWPSPQHSTDYQHGKRPIEVFGDSVCVGISIGLASFPHDGVTFSELVNAADEKPCTTPSKMEKEICTLL